MKKIGRLLNYCICLSMTVGLLACSDHRIPTVTPGASRLRVKTITQDQPNNTAKVSLFQYDGQGRLSSILAFQTPDSTVAPVESSVFQYDAQNRLIQLKRTEVRRGSREETYSYTYNAAGQVAGIGYMNNNGSGGFWSVTAKYDAANRLAGNTKFFTTGGLSTNESSTFTYTGNNLTFVTTSGQATAKGFTFFGSNSTTYAYDTNINPFYGVFVIPAPSVFAMLPGPIITYYTYYGGIDNLFNLSPNNVLSAVTSGGVTSVYTYTYNAANLPASRITATGNSVVEVLHFGYESY